MARHRQVGIPGGQATDAEIATAIATLAALYQAKDIDLDAFANITPSSNVISLLGAANYAAMRTLLSLGTMALETATSYLAKAGGTMSGELVMADQLLTRALLKDYGEEVQALGTLGTTETVDLTAGNVFTGTLDENVTITLSNPTASGDCCSWLAVLTQDGNGGNSVTITNGTWVMAGGGDPTISTVAGAKLLIMGVTVDGGSTWLCTYGGSTA